MTVMSKAEKQAIIAEYRRSDSDVGSPEVQIALLTKRINVLTQHMKENKKDRERKLSEVKTDER